MSKITVKHYLNKKLKPEIDYENDKELKLYPIYVSITVKSKNIRFKSFIQNNEIPENEFNTKIVNYKETFNKLKREKSIYELIVKRFISEIDKKQIQLSEPTKKGFYFDGQKKNIKNTDSFTFTLYNYIQKYVERLESVICDYCYKQSINGIYLKLKNSFIIDKPYTIKDFFEIKAGTNDLFLIKNIDKNSLLYLLLYHVYLSYSSDYSVKYGFEPTIIEKLENLLKLDFKTFISKYDFNKPFLKLFNIEFDQVIKNELFERSNNIIDDWIKELNY